MKKAADEMKRAHWSEITVSCDVTWQRRRFSCKNGDVTEASVNGLSSKTIDTETLKNYCSVQSAGHVCKKVKGKIMADIMIKYRPKYSGIALTPLTLFTCFRTKM